VLYQRLLRPVLFRLGGGDPETAHERTLRWLARLSAQPALAAALGALAGSRAAVAAPRTVFGVRFDNPVGLAAGMDKDGVALRAWPALGFGFVEVGTVTCRAQPGNDRPRLVRLPASEAVINRMGFNNAGAAALAAKLAAYGPLPVPLGISLGRSRTTPLADAAEDYLASLRLLEPYGDYFAVNVSSPNTPGLRSLQDRPRLGSLLAALRGATGRPILVKIAPDLTDPAIADLLDVCLTHGVAGVIATNTTVRRPGLAAADLSRGDQPGGLSGRPLTDRARQVVRFVHAETGGRLPIIGVGGVLAADDAVRLADAGASLVQLYTGLVYRGPGLVRQVHRALAGLPEAAGQPPPVGDRHE
jgi:dihydroorotate dehydrogenase